MKYNIAIVDTSGRISKALLSLSQELETEIFSYSSPGEFAAHLNKRSIPLDKLSSIIICILKPSENNTSSTDFLSLTRQIKKHSKLSLIPLLMIGPDNDDARNPYSNLHDAYLSAPVKMSELIHAVKELCAGKSISQRAENINLKSKLPDKPADVRDKSIESERRIATVSRTYFEAGKAMLSLDAPGSDAADKKIRKLKDKAEKTIGLTTEGCLDRAESMFREMDLKRDIEQLENLRGKNDFL